MLRTFSIYKSICQQDTDGKLLSNSELQGLQSHLLWMYKELEKVCDRHGLQVCLAFGNVIGAMRHNGWIPWDDDLDVHMPRKDYELLLTKYASELPDSFKVYSALTGNGAISRFAKILDTNTVFVDLTSERSEQSCVFLDIFPVDTISTHKGLNKLKKYWAYFLMYTATSVMQVEKRSVLYKNLMCSTKEGKHNYYFRQWWGRIFSFASSNRWHKWIEKFWKVKDDTGFVHVKQATSMCGKMIPSDLFFPAIKRTTEIGDVYLPHLPEKYLELIYGDWKKVPDDEDQWHHYVREFKLPGQSC